ncbi:ROK family protein [Dermacoccaceae bacterium W4C1]
MTFATAGIDVGGTRIKAVVLADGAVALEHTIATPPDIKDRFGEVLAGVLTHLQDSYRPPLSGVGVAVPGLVDEAGGIGLWSANLGWRDLDVPAALRPYTELPVRLGHDVRCGLLAEHRLGAATDIEHALFLPLGTGIAAALLLGGRTVSAAPWTGELGHVVIDPGGTACGCGKHGCLETVASASAIGRQWQSLGRTGDAADVAAAVASGDAEAVRIWRRAITALADVLAPVVATAGLEAVLIGGGLSRSGDTLIRPLQDELASRLGELAPVDVRVAGLGDRAGSLGAALLIDAGIDRS